MTTVTPINSQATVEAIYNENLDVSGSAVTAGHWRFFTYWWDEDGDPSGIEYGCPCGCGYVMTTAFDAQTPDEPTWTWNGKTDGITLKPYIRFDQNDVNGEVTGVHWCGELTDSVFRGNTVLPSSGSSLSVY